MKVELCNICMARIDFRLALTIDDNFDHKQKIVTVAILHEIGEDINLCADCIINSIKELTRNEG